MPLTSSWWILWKIHRHSTQAPCCHQHQQIQPRTGKTFHPQNLSQNKGTHIQKTVQNPRSAPSFIEQTLNEWLKLRVVKSSNSLYNSPILCVPKKQEQGLWIVQDVWELNQNSQHNQILHEGNKGVHKWHWQRNLRLFSMLDLTSRFWQMKLDVVSQEITSLTIPRKGHFHCITSPMGLWDALPAFKDSWRESCVTSTM